ncbi:EamA family transporter [Salinirarus marinus]|uniref:EamA family transporter n=1 Tax=Salinirarus marinus TaxID=3068310 RepID=UPI003C6C92AB
MSYLPWTVLALVAYSLVAPLVGYATTGDARVPSFVAAFYTNSILVVATVAVVVYENQNVLTYATHPKSPYLYAAGICLAVGILAYYHALSLGPVSVVVPVFAMFLVTSSLISIAFMNESLTARKLAGIGFAVLAVVLVSGE